MTVLWYIVTLCILFESLASQKGLLRNDICNYKSVQPKDDDDDDVGPRIVGGQNTTIAVVPYQVSLQSSYNHFCGGSIVTLNTVVTAAHCMKMKTPENLNIRAGSSWRDKGGVVVPVLWFISHPLYKNTTGDNDVSVLRLKHRLPFNDYIRPIRLAERHQQWAVNTPALISGWGVLHEADSDALIARYLQSVVLYVLDVRACQYAYGFHIFTPRMMCVGSYGDSKDSCRGDSGGPLVIDGVLAGIVSFGGGCGRPGIPGLYTSVPAVRDFIEGIAYIK